MKEIIMLLEKSKRKQINEILNIMSNIIIHYFKLEYDEPEQINHHKREINTFEKQLFKLRDKINPKNKKLYLSRDEYDYLIRKIFKEVLKLDNKIKIRDVMDRVDEFLPIFQLWREGISKELIIEMLYREVIKNDK